MFYFDWTYLLILPGLFLGLWAQGQIKSAYQRYSRMGTRLAQPASLVVADLLRRNGNRVVTVKPVRGELTDHYDPRDETLGLSQGVYNSSSIAALGIAAHEAGHAMQKMENYAPMKLRTAIVPVVNIGSNLATPLFFLGLLFSWKPLMTLGIFAFALSVLFSLITLPVEFDASRRAVRMLQDGGYVTGDELTGVQKVLRAAALTYVAAAVTSLLSLLRLLIIARDRD